MQELVLKDVDLSLFFWTASYVGIKELIPPYLDPNLEIKDLLTGVSFASAGSGFDPLTSAIPVMSLLNLPFALSAILFLNFPRRIKKKWQDQY